MVSEQVKLQSKIQVLEARLSEIRNAVHLMQIYNDDHGLDYIVGVIDGTISVPIWTDEMQAEYDAQMRYQEELNKHTY